jgi:hypothetical protein
LLFDTTQFSFRPSKVRHRDTNGWLVSFGWLGLSIWFGTWHYKPLYATRWHVAAADTKWALTDGTIIVSDAAPEETP